MEEIKYKVDKKSVGRPSKEENLKRKAIQVYFTEDECTILREASGGIPLSLYIRSILIKYGVLNSAIVKNLNVEYYEKHKEI
ncbi:MAG: hypothetical protein LBQ13_00630 [Endomicrobium sp.]|jgi:hypothetical protein|nr:hypothetical protein [Endomicrobium sp.]